MAKKFYARHLSGICNFAGCRNTTKDRYCNVHATHRHSRERSPAGKERKKFLDTMGWRRLKAAKLAQDPWCEDCLERGKREAAIDVHHTLKRSEHPGSALDIRYLKSLCKSCHSTRTGRGE